jgi:hypothetical protein
MATEEKSRPTTSAPRPDEAQRVQANMALQMRDAQAVDIADLIGFDRQKCIGTGLESGDIAKATDITQMDGSTFVPTRAVDLIYFRQ